ncbi:MAG: zinc-dependent metalloprotease [Hyphomonadaceae bacterium]|nr:zinc-dependent metalloprotease [Hyphomonadaceae bacterium]
MKLVKLFAAAAAVSALGWGAASAQVDADLTDNNLRIEFDHCPLSMCASFQPETEAELVAFLQDFAADRQGVVNAAAMQANAASSNTGTNGRGLKQGQQNNAPQVVYLRFGSASPFFNVFVNGVPFAGGIFPDYIYSQSDRDFIQQRLEDDYAAYNYEFTQTEPGSGDYTTLRIGDNDANPIDLAGGILFGRADNIDFGNDSRNDGAFVDASFWQLLAELDANFGTQNLAGFLGLGAPLDAAGIETFRRIAVVNQSANTASHELGHIQGLRHHDSFGAPGSGLPPARSPGEFIPLLETDQTALETLSHIMASGASAGLALNSPPFVDRFFSERSAVKLAINARTRAIEEDFIAVTNGKLDLNKVVAANPLLAGANSGGKLDVRAGLVNGTIAQLDEADHYEIDGRAGDVFNAEIISSSDSNIADFVLARLSLQLRQADGSFVEVAANQRTFEGLEPLIFDYTLPETGTYRIEVTGPDLVPLADGTLVSLGALGLNSFRTGDYNLLAYTVEGAPGNGPSSVPGPSN